MGKSLREEFFWAYLDASLRYEITNRILNPFFSRFYSENLNLVFLSYSIRNSEFRGGGFSF